MPDRGRDLKISILSDTSKFDLSDAAGDLDDVAHSSEDATDELKRLAAQGKDAQRELDRLSAEAKDNAFDELGKDAKDTARKMDDAFDAIGKSAKENLGHGSKLDHAADDAGDKLHGVRDEALDTGREMGASFDGSADSLKDAGQELLTTAGSVFGPVGVAIGAALASGFGIFRAKQEQLLEDTSEFVDRLIEGAGRLAEEGIVAKLQEMARDGSIVELGEQAERAGVNADFYARALAGDADATKAVIDEVRKHKKALEDTLVPGRKMTKNQSDQFYALDAVAKKLGATSDALDGAKSAYGRLDSASRSKIVLGVETDAPTPAELTATHRSMQQALGKPIQAPVNVKAPVSAAQDARDQMMAYFRRNPLKVSAQVVIRKPGTKAERDIA